MDRLTDLKVKNEDLANEWEEKSMELEELRGLTALKNAMGF